MQGGEKRNRLDPRDRGRHPRDLGGPNSLAPYLLQDNFLRYCHMLLNLLRIPWQEWCEWGGLEELLVMPIALLLLLLFLFLLLLDCAGSCLRFWPRTHHWRCHRGVTICKRDCRKASWSSLKSFSARKIAEKPHNPYFQARNPKCNLVPTLVWIGLMSSPNDHRPRCLLFFFSLAPAVILSFSGQQIGGQGTHGY